MSLSKRKNVGYLLPTIPNPETRRYVCVPVPNEERHIQAFLAQIDMLGYWYTWEKDAAKTGKEAALVWQEIARSVRADLYGEVGCEGIDMDVRQNSETPCILEKNPTGLEWIPFANLRLCPPLFRMNGTTPEISPDGGETWTPVDTVTPPITERSGSEASIKCLASANLANTLRILYEEVDRQFLSGASPYVIASAIITLIALLIFYPIALPLVLEFFVLLYATFETLGSGSYTSAVEAKIKCFAYCGASASGGVVTFDYAYVLDAIQAQESPLDPIWTILAILVQIIGEDGLNLAGATTAIATADCSGCNCNCPHWDFTSSAVGWGAMPGDPFSFARDSGGIYGTWNFYGDKAMSACVSITLPVGCTLTGFYATISGEMGYAPSGHTEMWVGTNRTDGLGATEHNYGQYLGSGLHSYTRTIVGSGQTVLFGLGSIDNGTAARWVSAGITYDGEKPIFAGGTPC